MKKLILTLAMGWVMTTVGCNMLDDKTDTSVTKTEGGATQLDGGLDVDGDGTVDVTKEDVPAGSVHMSQGDTIEVVELTSDMIITRETESICENGAAKENTTIDTSTYVIENGKLILTNKSDCEVLTFDGNSDEATGLWVSTELGGTAIENCTTEGGEGGPDSLGIVNAYMSADVNSERIVVMMEGDLCVAEMVVAGMQEEGTKGDGPAMTPTVKDCANIDVLMGELQFSISLAEQGDDIAMTVTSGECSGTTVMNMFGDEKCDQSSSEEEGFFGIEDAEFNKCMESLLAAEMLRQLQEGAPAGDAGATP